jgi:hypothetical protein
VLVQVIQGQVSDAGSCAPRSTGGSRNSCPVPRAGSRVARLDRRLTDDGRFIALARFESEEAARRNSDRPEQDRWWTEIAKRRQEQWLGEAQEAVRPSPPGSVGRVPPGIVSKVWTRPTRAIGIRDACHASGSCR